MAMRQQKPKTTIAGGKTIAFGNDHFIVRDDKAVSAFVDGVTEIRTDGGIVYVSFAQTVRDGSNTPELDVLVRLRMTVAVMEKLAWHSPVRSI